MRSFRFHPDALLEADESAKFYEERQKGLGKRFVEALTDSITRIRRSPELYGEVNNDVRKCRILRFPYDFLQKVLSRIYAQFK